jgi:hypothetical protein
MPVTIDAVSGIFLIWEVDQITEDRGCDVARLTFCTADLAGTARICLTVMRPNV